MSVSRQIPLHHIALMIWMFVAVVFAGRASSASFEPAEFAARRAAVMRELGDAVAVVHGSAEWSGFRTFRQNAQFYYLTGVEVPRAVLIIDGQAHTSTLFLPPPPPGPPSGIDPPELYPGEQAVRATGIETVLDRNSVLPVLVELGKQGRSFYAPFRSESRTAGSPEVSTKFERQNATDPLDGRPSREAALVARLNALSARQTQDLDPILDRLRLVKSPAELQVLREAARLAQLGLMEAMRSARPGLYEHQLAAAAQFEVLYHNAAGPGYFPLASTGTNTQWGHYHAGQSPLGPSELVSFDFGPDYQNYVADITRMFPSNGKFTPRQHEMYGIYLALYKALEASVRPGVTPHEIVQAAAVKMDAVVAAFSFSDGKIRKAAQDFVAEFRAGKFPGHGVGLEVHEPPVPYREPPVLWEKLVPGMVITLEPAMRIADEHTRLRLEDEYLITADGCEKLSVLAPEEPGEVEKLMREQGVARRHRNGG